MADQLANGIVQTALTILGMPPLDVQKMPVEALFAAQAQAESQRTVTNAWLSSARFTKFTQQRPVDEAMLKKVEEADRLWADRIRAIQAEHARRKDARRAAPVNKTLHGEVTFPDHDAKALRELCRKMGGEIERLQAQVSAYEARDAAQAKVAHLVDPEARLHHAYYESARFILSKSTHDRIEAKAKEVLRDPKWRSKL